MLRSDVRLPGLTLRSMSLVGFAGKSDPIVRTAWLKLKIAQPELKSIASNAIFSNRWPSALREMATGEISRSLWAVLVCLSSAAISPCGTLAPRRIRAADSGRSVEDDSPAYTKQSNDIAGGLA